MYVNTQKAVFNILNFMILLTLLAIEKEIKMEEEFSK